MIFCFGSMAVILIWWCFWMKFALFWFWCLNWVNICGAANCNYSLRFGRDGDPEPGRCKRTDGKKWRCSKEAIPDERYCDRHLKKRGHPRSRKLVEQVSCKKARHGQKLDTCSNGSASTNSLPPVFLCSNGDGVFEHGTDLLPHKEPRWELLIAFILC